MMQKERRGAVEKCSKSAAQLTIFMISFHCNYLHYVSMIQFSLFTIPIEVVIIE